MRIALPEQVWIDVEAAGFGSRALAYLTDVVIRWSVIFVVFVLLLTAGNLSSLDWLGLTNDLLYGEGLRKFYLAVLITVFALIEVAYPVYFEVWGDGATPGKKLFGLRVVDEGGLPITFAPSLIRNVMLVVDLLPVGGLVAALSMALTSKAQRLGDLAAKTMVITVPVKESYELKSHGSSDQSQLSLPLKLHNVLERYRQRRPSLSISARQQMQATLQKALQEHLSPEQRQLLPDHCPDAWLEEVYRRSRPQRHTERQAVTDDALDWPAWQEKLREAEILLCRLPDSGAALSAEELYQISAQYQELCQRYAYLETFYPDTNEARLASRLVREGRRLIYGRRPALLAQGQESLLQRVPAAYTIIRPYCTFALLVVVLTAVFTLALIQVNPQLLWTFIGEQAAAELQSGKLWTDDITQNSGVISAFILSNNIRVAFTAFALGISAGVGTLLVLISNVVHLVGIFAALVQYNMAGRLLEFILAHGPLELSVILVAAACGLAIGDALLRPGHLRRSAKLQQNAQAAITVVFFSALCLIPAGLVEAYLSPQPALPWVFKLLVGLLLALPYWSFLLKGRLAIWAPPQRRN